MIAAREITVAVEDKSVEYNGSEQSGNSEYSFTNVVEGQTATIGYTAAKGTLVDTYDNGAYADDLAIVDGEGNDVTSNYTLVQKTPGKLNIIDRTEKYAIEVVANSNTGNVYDGTAKSATGFETLSFEVEGNTYTVEGLETSDPSSTNVATLTNAISGTAVVKDADGNDVTAQFEVGTRNGSLVIGKRSVTLTSATDSKVYDKTALTNDTVTVTGDGFVTGEGAAYDVTGSQTDAGESANAFTYTLNEGTKADNYDISKVEGTLTVTSYDDAITVTITEHGGEAKYDGEEHTVTGYDVTSIKVGENDTTLYTTDDFSFSGDATIKGTNAGTYAMGLTAANFTNDNKNFTNVTFVIVDGSLEIKPIDVTVAITGHSNTTNYDGAEHSVSGYDVEIGNSLYKEADFTFSGTAAAARTDAGTTNMGLTAGQFANTNPNFGTVTFNVTDGYQTINPIDVTVEITGHKNTATYDSAEHSVSGYDVKIGNSLYKEADFTFSGTAEAKRTEEGTTTMGLAAEQFANTNSNFRTVTFTVTDGYQTITPVDEVVVTITGHNNTADYDGTEHTVTGYDVEISNDLYKEADFTFNGTAAAVRTDAGTTNMGLNEAQFSNTNKNFAKVTFEVTDGYQTISPISAVVTITGHNSTADYNGAEHTVTGYDVEISNPLYKEADFTFNGDATAKRTDVGTTNMNLASSQFVNNNGNFNSVTFNVTDGYQTISPIDAVVTIIGANNTTDYDGEGHSVSGYTATADTDLYDVTKDFTFSGTAAAARTDAGTTNMGLAAEQFVNINPNFATVTFNVTDGYQTINPINATVTIVGASNTATYDSEEHSVSGYTATADTELYDVENDFTFSGTASAARTDEGTTTMNLAAEQFVNTNANFATVTFNVTDGYQAITPIDEVVVTITGNSNTTAYDGEEHSVSGYEVKISNPLYKESDFTFSGTAEAAQTDAGTTTMGLAAEQFANTNGNFAKVTFNVTDGYQTITPINATVTITGANNTADYDGEEHSVSGYTATANTGLYDVTKDITFSGTAAAARTDAGTTNMGLAADQFANTNPNFATVTFNVTDGYQKIEQIDAVVTIIGANDTAAYDGEEHSVSGYTATAHTELYDVTKDFTFSGTAAAARTDAGTTNMNLASGQFANTNGNFKSVTFNVTDGYQTITQIDAVVTISGANNTADYDGEEHSVSGYTATADTRLYDVTKDFTFNGTAAAARTDAGTTNMNLTAEQFVNTNPNFATVTFNVTDGYQTINPIDVTVTITEHSDEVAYDGEAHEVSGYDVEISNPLYTEADFSFSGTDSVSGTNVASYAMELQAADFTNTNDNFENVTFVIVDGSLEIKPIDVTVAITGHSNTTNYDGAEHSVSGYDVEIGNSLYKEADFTFSGTAAAARTDAGTTNMGLTAGQFANTNPNFGTVTFNVTDGYQTINPIDVTVEITGHKNTATYDSAEHSVSGYDVKIGNSLYKEADFTFSGTAEAKRTEEGTTTMGLAAEQFANTNSNFRTVTFTVTDGYQTITPVDEVVVTITGHNNTADYDGTEHTVTGYDVEISNDLYKEADFTFNGTAAAVRTDAGTTNMGLNEAQFSNTNKNFAKVTFEVTDGYQTISPISAVVTITGHNSTADYNGAEHTVTGYDVEISNPLYKEADFTFNGDATAKRTDVGTTNMNLASSQFVNNNGNFNSVTFNVTDGYQTISPIDAVVTIIGANNTTDYDGEGHSVSGYTATADTDLYDVTKDFTFSGTAAAARTDAGTTNMGLAAEQFVNINPNFATVTFNVTDGYQTINPINATVTIVGASNTATYDSEEHSVSGYTATADTELYDVENDFTFSGTASAARTDEGTTTMNLAAEQFVNTNANFATVTFNVTDGYQAITPIDEVVVTITGNSNTTAYDGEEHSVSGYEVKISNPLYKESDFTFSGTAEAAQTDAGTTTMGLAAEQFANTNGNFAKVTFNVTDGYQTITPINATVTITGANNTADYDGEEHSVSGYTATANTGLYDVTKDITFSGTAAAARTDAGTTNMGLAADQFANTNPNFATVTFNVTDGYQKIEQIDAVVTIIGANDTAAYDGEEHSVSGYTATAHTELYDVTKDFTFSGTAAAARTDAGTTNMNLASGQFANTNGNFKSVTFNVTDGYQTITQIDAVVTISGANNTADYDGEEHSVSGYTATADTRLYDVTKDFTFNGTAAAARTDAGTTNMNLTAEQFVNTNPNFATVTFNVTDGYQTINPIDVTVTITEHSDTVTYNAAEHTVTGYDTAIGNELYKVTDFIFSGNDSVSGTNAGTYDMNLTAADFTNINANFANVTFVIIDGTLTINPKKITITADDKTMIYGDDEPVLTATTAGLEGSDYIATTQTREAGKDIGTYTITATVTPGQDITKNYDIELIPGTLTIQPRPVTVTAADKAKVFGTADPALTATVTGMATGESASLIKYELSRVTGEDVGEYAINATGDEAQGNYTVSYVPATLTILPEDAVIVTITAKNGTYKYDGTEKDISGYDVEINNELYKATDFTFNGSAELKARNAGTYRTEMKASDFVNTNANFENVKFIVVNGTLEITKRNVTLTSGSAEKVFDGTPLTNEEITVSGDGFVTGEGVNVTVTGRRTTEGESDNTFTYTMAANTQAGNYDITSEFGKLKVTENDGEELVEYHKLTITYQYENGDVIKTFARDYMAGTRYYVASDKIANYKADTAAVSGTMGNADINVTVVYSKATHTLTVKFVSMTDSSQVTTPVTMELTSGDSYTVFVPAVEGYTAMTEKVTGIMPDSDRSVTVFFLPEGTEAGIAGIGGGAQVPIEIEDFGTPLGIGDSILGGGEVIE